MFTDANNLTCDVLFVFVHVTVFIVNPYNSKELFNV